MPMIECTLIKGYDKDTRQLLAERFTDAAAATIGAHPDLVIVTIKEVDGENYMRGGSTATPPLHQPILKQLLKPFSAPWKTVIWIRPKHC